MFVLPIPRRWALSIFVPQINALTECWQTQSKTLCKQLIRLQQQRSFRSTPAVGQ